MVKKRIDILNTVAICLLDIGLITFFIVFFNIKFKNNRINLENSSIDYTLKISTTNSRTEFENFFSSLEVIASFINYSLKTEDITIEELLFNESGYISYIEGEILRFNASESDFFKSLTEISKNNNTERVSIMTKKGVLYSSSGVIADANGRASLINTLDGNRTIEYISSSSITNEGAFILSVPIINDDEVIAVATATLDKEEILSFLYDGQTSYETICGFISKKFGNIFSTEEKDRNVYFKDTITTSTMNDIFDIIDTEATYQFRYEENNKKYITEISKLNYDVDFFYNNGNGYVDDELYVYLDVNTLAISTATDFDSLTISLIIITMIVSLVNILFFSYSYRKRKKRLLKLVKIAKDSKKDLDNFINKVPTGLYKCVFFKSGPKTEYYSDNVFLPFGYTKKEFETILGNSENEKIDLEHYGFLYEKVMEIYQSNEVLDYIGHIYDSDHKLRYIKLYGKIINCVNGGYTFIGTITDVTKEIQIEQELKYEHIRYGLAIKLLDVYLLEFDVKNDILTSFYQSNDEEKKEVFSDFLKSDYINKYISLEYQNDFKDIILGKKEKIEFVGLYNNETHWYKMITESLKDEGITKTFSIMMKIDEQKQLQDELIRQAELDPQTLVYNKVSFEKNVNERLTTNQDGVLMIVDIDDFKRINDYNGHLFGDIVIITLASKLKEFVGNNGITGRIGGDEFGLFFNHFESDDKFIEKLKEIIKIGTYPFTTANGKKISSTISVGATKYEDNESNYESMFKACDIALYDAKKKGKRQFVIYDTKLHSKKVMGYYNNYKTFDKKINSNFIDNVLNYSFEIMNNGTNLSNSIKMLFERLGIMMNLKSTGLFNYDAIEGVTLLCEWKYDDNDHMLDNYVFPDEMINKFKSIPFEQEILVDEPSKFAIFDSNQTPNAFVVIRDFIKKELNAFVIYEAKDYVHYWTKTEVNYLKIIGRIVMTYMVRNSFYDKQDEKVISILNTDQLTGLKTLRKFKIDSITVLKNKLFKYVLIYSDIISFKHYNDNYGYDNGDLILKKFTNHIKELLPKSAIIARVNADEFLILVRYEQREDIDKIMDKIDEFTVKTQQGEYINNIGIRSGIYFIPDENIMSAIDNANIARKMIKDLGKSSYSVFNYDVLKEYSFANDIMSEAENALKNNEFVVYYQPKYNMDNKKIIGAEALIRWNRNGELVPPGKFIHVFEKRGYIEEIDFFVYEEVFRFIKENDVKIPISANVSRVHLNDSHFVEKILSLKEKYDIPTSLIDFEITETIFFDNRKKAITIINELAKNGFLISIDDFGTAYSSLSILEDIHVDTLKIDRSFLPDDEKKLESKEIIIGGVIDMAKKLEIDVLCEGVETKFHVDIVKRLGCNKAQGFYYSKPIDKISFISLLRKKNA